MRRASAAFSTTDHAAHRVVGDVLFARKRGNRNFDYFRARATDIEHHRLGLQVAIGAERQGARRQHFRLGTGDIAHRHRNLAASVTALVQSDLRREPRIRQRARRNHNIVKFHIMRGVFAPGSHDRA